MAFVQFPTQRKVSSERAWVGFLSTCWLAYSSSSHHKLIIPSGTPTYCGLSKDKQHWLKMNF